jgi:hypothetical protein
VDTKWRFFAASHRKGACYGIWGKIKRAARMASLHSLYEGQIMTSRHLYELAVAEILTAAFILLKATTKKQRCSKRGSGKPIHFSVLIKCSVLFLPQRSKSRQVFSEKNIQHHTYIYWMKGIEWKTLEG